MLKKIISLFLILGLLLSLAACGSDAGRDDDSNRPGNGGNGGNAGEAADLSADILMAQEGAVSLGTPEVTLDPQQVYDNLTYIPEMFYGHYRLLGGEDVAKDQAADLDTMKLTIEGEESEVCVLPFRMDAGPNTLGHWVTRITGYNWCRMYYMCLDANDQYYLDYWYCAYTVEGNTVTLNPIASWVVDEESNSISYSMSDEFITYEFSFRGRELTLSAGDDSVTMYTGLDVYDDLPYISVDAYLSGSHALLGIEEFGFAHYEEGDDGYAYVETRDGYSTNNLSAKMEANGLLTVSIPWEDETVTTVQLVYFYCGNDGLVLTDGTNTYCYNYDWHTFVHGSVSANVTQEDQEILDQLPEAEVEDIFEKKDDLLADLTAAFADAGISVTVNEATGELAMDASMLFGGDSAELTDEGKAFLDTFVAVYASIINNEKYDGFVAKTLVEGHTAKLANSTYESGLPLSQERADAVTAYCAGVESSLADTLEAVGMSCSVPIYAADGTVDLAASRRVSFKFIINLQS